MGLNKDMEYMVQQVQDVLADHAFDWRPNIIDGKQWGKCYGCGFWGRESVYEFKHNTNCPVDALQSAVDGASAYRQVKL